jgi:hypothetical protein
MSLNYQHLALAEVRPGMMLSDVLLDKQGQVLLPEGTVLTESMLALLPRHAVETLPILFQQPESVDPEITAAMLAEREARLDHLFRKNVADDAQDWATGILRHYVKDFRLQREIQE